MTQHARHLQPLTTQRIDVDVLRNLGNRQQLHARPKTSERSQAHYLRTNSRATLGLRRKSTAPSSPEARNQADQHGQSACSRSQQPCLELCQLEPEHQQSHGRACRLGNPTLALYKPQDVRARLCVREHSNHASNATRWNGNITNYMDKLVDVENRH